MKFKEGDWVRIVDVFEWDGMDYSPDEYQKWVGRCGRIKENNTERSSPLKWVVLVFVDNKPTSLNWMEKEIELVNKEDIPKKEMREYEVYYEKVVEEAI